MSAPDFADTLIGKLIGTYEDMGHHANTPEYTGARRAYDKAWQDLRQALTVPAPEHAEDFPSVRDQFAMAALTGLLAGLAYAHKKIGGRIKFQMAPGQADTARQSYGYADAMMAARKGGAA